MNKYLKRKYRELKMYVKNGWWGYARQAPRSGRQDANMSEGMKLLSRRFGLATLCHYKLSHSDRLKNAHSISVRFCPPRLCWSLWQWIYDRFVKT